LAAFPVHHSSTLYALLADPMIIYAAKNCI